MNTAALYFNKSSLLNRGALPEEPAPASPVAPGFFSRKNNYRLLIANLRLKEYVSMARHLRKV